MSRRPQSEAQAFRAKLLRAGVAFKDCRHLAITPAERARLEAAGLVSMRPAPAPLSFHERRAKKTEVARMWCEAGRPFGLLASLCAEHGVTENSVVQRAHTLGLL
jgi:hypothetical protein